jgi:hypothetical protein
VYSTTEQSAAETLQKPPSKDHVDVHLDVHSWVLQTLDMPTETDRPMQTHLAIELAWASRWTLHLVRSRSSFVYHVSV